MQHHSAEITSADGLALFTRRWAPDRETVAHVVLVHGVHEHSGRYAYPASVMMQHGIEVHALDLRGHGQSEGERARVEDFARYSDDAAQLVRDVVDGAGDVPVFLLGHSMGGLVASRGIVDHGTMKLSGLILSSPALAVEAPPLLQSVSSVVARWLPNLPVTRVDLSRLSHDPRVERAYREDPLCTVSGVRAALGHQILTSIEHVRAHVEAFTLPLFVFHGTDDRLTSPDGSRWLVEHAPADDKTLTLYDGFYHETMNEVERDTVLAALATWVVDRAV